MKKTILIIVITVLIVIIAVAAVFIIFSKEDKKQSEQREVSVIPEKEKLSDWMQKTGEIQCFITSADGEITLKKRGNQVRMEGLPYAFSGETEIEFTNEEVITFSSDGTALTSGGYVYIWRDAKGVRYENNELTKIDSERKQSGDFLFLDWQEAVRRWESLNSNYECEIKDLDDGEFSPPSDIEFTDFSEIESDIINKEEVPENELDIDAEDTETLPEDDEIIDEVMENGQIDDEIIE